MRLEVETSALDLLYPLDHAHLPIRLLAATNLGDNRRSRHHTDVNPLIDANQ